MNENISPAMIIGLGGSGQWALTYVKKNLLEQFKSVPPQIKILAFDTTGADTEVNKGEPIEQIDEPAQIGSIHLDSSEFVYLGGNIKKICEQTRQGKHNHIASWLQTDAYLGGRNNQIGLSNDDFNLSRGAGTRRQFGRMAIYYDLLQHNDTKILGKISDGLQGIVTHSNPEFINIFIVASIAGGTGSGMLIDIAHLTKILAEKMNPAPKIILRGYVVLHNTFQSVINVNHIKPQAFAAVRELNRFMTMFGEKYPINYTDDPNYLELHTIYESKLFDSCFLMEVQGSLQDKKPKHSVYPGIADGITMMLDPRSGDAFQQHYKNVNNRLALVQKRKKIALYSSLGTFSFIFPAEEIIQSCSLRFASEFLENYFISSENRKDNNKKRSAEDTIGFLLQATSRSGIQHPTFLHCVAQDVRDYPVNKIDAIQAFISRDRHEWIESFRLVGDDVATQKINEDLQMLAHVQLKDEVKTSLEWGDPLESSAVRIPEQIEAFKLRYLGKFTASTGKRQGGELQNAIHSSLELIEARYREVLLEYVNQLFDPMWSNVPNPRLSYVQDFLNQLVSTFERFAMLIDNARQSLNQQLSSVRADTKRELEMLETEKKRISGLSYSIRKYTKIITVGQDSIEERCIQYAQSEIELEMQDLIFAELFSLAQSFRTIAQSLLNDARRWVTLLSEGGVTRKELGVLAIIKNVAASLNHQRQEKNLIPTHRYLTNPVYEDNLYLNLSNGKFDHLLSRLRWSCSFLNGKGTVGLDFDGQEISKEVGLQTQAEFLYKELLAAARLYFLEINEQTAAKRLNELYSPENLVKMIMDKCKPMIHVQRENEAGSDQEMKTFVSIAEKGAIEFVQQTEKFMQNNLNSIKDAQIISASDPYRCIVLSTIDLLGVDSITSLNDAREWYDIYPTDKRQLHIFPAEVHAMEFEDRLDEYPIYYQVTYKTHRPHHFSPRVVMLLEDLEKFKLFVLCYSLGIVKTENNPGQLGKKQYILRVKRSGAFDKSAEIPLTKPEIRPSMFQAIHTFVFNQPDKPQANASDLIVALDNRSVLKSRVGDTIKLFEDLNRRGMEYFVMQLGTFIDEEVNDLRPFSSLLQSEFRYFLMDQIYSQIDTDDTDALSRSLINKSSNWLSGLKDDVPFNQKLANYAAQLIGNAIRRNTKSDGAHLRRHLEDFILDEIKVLKHRDDPDERDLGILMHMIILDYIKDLG